MTPADDLLTHFLRSLVIQLPVLVLWMVGILIAMVRWPKHPWVSLLAVAAFGLSLLISVAMAGAWAMLPRMLDDSDFLREHRELVYPIIGLVNSSAHAVCGILLLFAVFGWRSRPAGPVS